MSIYLPNTPLDEKGLPLQSIEDRCASVDVSKRIVATAYTSRDIESS